MHLAIEPTDQLTHIDGVPCRVWRGVTDQGVVCMVFVHRIAANATDDVSELEATLLAVLPPGQLIDVDTLMAGPPWS